MTRKTPLAGLGLVLAAVSALAVLAPVPALGTRANECAKLVPTGGREMILNACDQCRVISIIRSRPGNSAPVSRSYNVPAKSTFPVPFRGPGRSRISSDLPCKGETGAPVNLMDPNPAGKTAEACVSLERAKAGGVQLVNGCKVCKAALIERVLHGRSAGRQAFIVAGRAEIAVPPNGATQVGLVGEIDCPKN